MADLENPSRRSFVQIVSGGTVAGAGLLGLGYSVKRAVDEPSAEELLRDRPGELEDVELRVNGRIHRLRLEQRRTLLLALREDLGLTGTKKGCNMGQCGACTVLLDGEPIYSCFMLASDARGKEIQTIEGLERRGRLHPVQQAFVERMGSQCGHCSPGMIMSAVALLRDNARPTREEVRHALSGNLCRCGNYENEIDAVLAAAGVESKGQVTTAPSNPSQADGASEIYRYIGTSGPAIDAYEKATGRARYTGDLGFHPDDEVRDPLHLKVVRSPHPHADLVRIGTDRASKVSGYVGMVTWQDIPGLDDPKVAKRDRQPMNRRARYVGDAVAAVVATSQYAAEAALTALEIEWQPLPTRADGEANLREPKTAIHEGGPVAGFGGPQPSDVPTIEFHQGDIEAGFKAADRIVEGRYGLHVHSHVPIEPHACIASHAGGRLTLWDTQQSVFHAREIMAEVMRMPPEDIRVECRFVGGGFGGKCLDTTGKTLYQAIAAIASKKFGRPVRYEYTMKELIVAEDTRNPYHIDIRTGVKKDGSITAIDCRAVQPTGGYASSGPAVIGVTGECIINTYRAAAFRFRGFSVYTNGPVGGEFRGFGHPQGVFAREIHVDEIAAELGIDPVEFRMRNTKRTGDPATFSVDRDTKFGNIGAEACLTQAAEAIGWANWQPPSAKQGRMRRGIGIRHSQEHSGRSDSDGLVWLDRDGVVHVPTGTGNLGTLSHTGIARIVAEVLGIPPEELDVTWGDTTDVAWDFVTDASRAVHCNGKAFYNAAVDLKRQLESMGMKDARTRADLRRAAAGASAPRVDFAPYFDESTDVNPLLNEATGEVTQRPSMRLKPATEQLARRLVERGMMVGLGHYVWNPSVQSWGTSAAEVEVDMLTGQVSVLKLVAVHDLGRVIYRTGAEAQVYGGTIMGLGYAMLEELVVDPNTHVPLYMTLHELRPPTILDYPQIDMRFVEAAAQAGPFGAKGLGENPFWNAAAAVGNAIYNATGVRVRSLPFSWPRMYEALREVRS